MERMKIEIEKSEYDRLKSREEKLMAYYEWFVDKENDLATVEDVVNKNIELEEENKKLKEENEKLKEDNRVKKINEYDEECVKANTLKRDFSKQRIRELEEDLHMTRVENDMLRKQLRGDFN